MVRRAETNVMVPMDLWCRMVGFIAIAAAAADNEEKGLKFSARGMSDVAKELHVDMIGKEAPAATGKVP